MTLDLEGKIRAELNEWYQVGLLDKKIELWDYQNDVIVDVLRTLRKYLTDDTTR